MSGSFDVETGSPKHTNFRRKTQSLPRFIGHHVVHWADGGETSLDNTILLCSKHHMLLHDGRFEIKPGPAGDWLFLSSG